MCDRLAIRHDPFRACFPPRRRRPLLHFFRTKRIRDRKKESRERLVMHRTAEIPDTERPIFGRPHFRHS